MSKRKICISFIKWEAATSKNKTYIIYQNIDFLEKRRGTSLRKKVCWSYCNPSGKRSGENVGIFTESELGPNLDIVWNNG